MNQAIKKKFIIGLLYSPGLDYGGVESHLLSLAKRGDPSLYDWLFISPVSDTFEQKLHLLNLRSTPWELQNVLFDFKAMNRLVHLLKANRVSLLHIHSSRAAVPGRLAARLAKIPVVMTVHLPAQDYYFRRQEFLKRWLTAHLEKVLNHTLTNRLIYVSRRVYENEITHKQCPAERAIFIPNGIDLDQYYTNGRQATREKFGVNPETVIICFVGRLDEQKGIDILLHSLSLLAPNRAWKLWLIGDSKNKEKLQALAQLLGLETRTIFWGLREDTPELLRASDIFVLPSRFEGMSIALLEAMACSLPCVVTDVGDSSRLVEQRNNGIVVPAGDTVSLAEALLLLLNDANIRQDMGTKARQKALEYSDIHMAQQIQEVYASILV